MTFRCPTLLPRAVDAQPPSALRRAFGVWTDVRAWTSLFFMLLALATGIVYFTFAVTGLSLSVGLSILIIGLPFFLAFVGLARVLSLVEGRLIEALTGERMPRRPPHPGAPKGLWARIGDMLRDPRTWTTLGYFVLMLPLGVAYFSIAVIGLAFGASLLLGPLWYAGSFAIGAAAALAGDRVSLGFVAETERQVEGHLDDHLSRLPAGDERSRAILEAMRQDEKAHGDAALAAGGTGLPAPARAAMRATSRVMTFTSYWV